MKAHHWVGAVILLLLAFFAGKWYAQGKVTLP